MDQRDLERLLQKPTKSTALACYHRQVAYWFQVGPETGSPDGWISDSEVEVIAIEHDCKDRLTDLIRRHLNDSST